MAFKTPTPDQQAWAEERMPRVMKQLADVNTAALAQLREIAQTPNHEHLQWEQVLAAVNVYLEARQKSREGLTYAAGLSIMSGAPSGRVARQTRRGRYELQREMYAFDDLGQIVVRPVPRNGGA
ncbi:hypothetical protein [Mycobacteroides abscessus]|uniref:hypothetical protein n=1 Tax=Mycobacteroides abscessus TaxID=36809 RepID=UPI0018782C89|nr:hypothetical protein [Mycobacteroides abscessus]